MEVILAQNSGFCFGVKRAIEIALNEADKHKNSTKKIFTYGPIIHNDIVISELKSKGIEDYNSINSCPNNSESIVIIRSHGVGPLVYDELKNKNIEVVDATCPFVTKIHELAYEYSKTECTIIIFGDKNHSEVKGIVGWAGNNCHVVASIEDLENLNLKKDSKYVIFSQTTFDVSTFKILVEFLTKNGYNFKVFDTICPSTKLRQDEVFEISRKVSIMLVIGSKNSSNTKKLFNIASANCSKTYLIENLSDLEKINFLDVDSKTSKIGIGAGASAPEKIIQEVVEYVRNEF